MSKVSVIVPSRNERFLVPTVKDLLAKAKGELEVIVILEGYWDHELPRDSRLKILHHGTPKGMRAAINAAVAISTGDYICKLDAHCMVAEGFDVQLAADYEEGWVLVPRRYALDPEAWAWDTSNGKYPIDYHFLSCPINTPGDSTDGLHGSPWTARREQRKQVQIDDEMSSQGSCYFLSRKYWDRMIGPLDWQRYGSFTQEMQEVGLKAWLSGGAIKVTKNTWYAHLRKSGKWGRGYSMSGCGHEAGTQFCSWFWVHDEPFLGRIHNLQWLIEKFWPVPSWPSDLDSVLAEARRRYVNPYAAA